MSTAAGGNGGGFDRGCGGKDGPLGTHLQTASELGTPNWSLGKGCVHVARCSSADSCKRARYRESVRLHVSPTQSSHCSAQRSGACCWLLQKVSQLVSPSVRTTEAHRSESSAVKSHCLLPSVPVQFLASHAPACGSQAKATRALHIVGLHGSRTRWGRQNERNLLDARESTAPPLIAKVTRATLGG